MVIIDSYVVQTVTRGGDDTVDASPALGGSSRTRLVAYGGEGNDTLSGSNFVDALLGETGADVLSSGPYLDGLYGSGMEGNNVPYPAGTRDDDYLDGGGGNDLLEGGKGSDVELCGEGDDRFPHSGLGVQTDGRNDLVDGGPGRDVPVYGRGTQNMYIALNNVADDGEYFEEDNIKDTVEDIYTGDGHDTILAFGDIDNTLVGGTWAADTIEGAVDGARVETSPPSTRWIGTSL